MLVEDCSLECELAPTFNAQIAAEERLGHIDILDLHFDVVVLTVRLLRAFELAAWSEEGGGPTRDHLRLCKYCSELGVVKQVLHTRIFENLSSSGEIPSSI